MSTFLRFSATRDCRSAWTNEQKKTITQKKRRYGTLPYCIASDCLGNQAYSTANRQHTSRTCDSSRCNELWCIAWFRDLLRCADYNLRWVHRGWAPRASRTSEMRGLVRQQTDRQTDPQTNEKGFAPDSVCAKRFRTRLCVEAHTHTHTHRYLHPPPFLAYYF